MSSGKKVPIGTRPSVNRPTSTNVDAWVTNRVESSDTSNSIAMKRLTIDIAESLHREVKTECASQGINIADVVRKLLQEWMQKQ